MEEAPSPRRACRGEGTRGETGFVVRRRGLSDDLKGGAPGRARVSGRSATRTHLERCGRAERSK